MKSDNNNPITDEQLDTLLGGSFKEPADDFADKVFAQLKTVSDDEIDLLLSGNVERIADDFIDRTLGEIETDESTVIPFPTFKWISRTGMVAAVFAAGIFSWSMLSERAPDIEEATLAHLDFSNMSLEELLYMEESLSSAKVLIELDKTIPLHNLIDTVES